VSQVVTGLYDLQSLDLPVGFYVESARQAGRDVLVDGVKIERDTASLEIRLKTDTATLRGTVVDRVGKPVFKAAVVIIPEPPLFDSQLDILRRGWRTDDEGRFELHSVMPGAYRAFAVIESAGFEVAGFRNDGKSNHGGVGTFADPRLFERIKDQGMKLDLKPSADATIELKVLNEP
jgi:protocatechuate 3,4-dioxygenase beta subunit